MLVDARVLSELRVITSGHQAVFGAEHLRPLPDLRDFNLVDPIAPGIPNPVNRFVFEIGQGQSIELAAVERAELAVLRLEPLEKLGWEGSLQVLAEKRIRIVLISKAWRGLLKGHTLLDLAGNDNQ